MSDTAERGHIMDIDDGEDTAINLEYYEAVQRTGGNAEWIETPIRGRSEPHHTYVSTTARNYVITAKIVASVGEGDLRTGDNVEQDVAFLTSLEYPDYVDGGSLSSVIKPPHRCRIWLEGVIDEVGYIKGLTVTYPGVHDYINKPIFVDVTFTFIPIRDTPFTYDQVRSMKEPIYV